MWECSYLFKISSFSFLNVYWSIIDLRYWFLFLQINTQKWYLSGGNDPGLLDHMVILFLTFSGSSILFSIEAAPIYTPPSVYGRRGSGSLFSTSSPTLFFLSVKCEVLGDWFAFVWWLVVLSTFLCAHRPFVCLLWENLFGFSAHLVTWWWWWFCYFVVSSLYPPIRYMVWKYFLP